MKRLILPVLLLACFAISAGTPVTRMHNELLFGAPDYVWQALMLEVEACGLPALPVPDSSERVDACYEVPGVSASQAVWDLTLSIRATDHWRLASEEAGEINGTPVLYQRWRDALLPGYALHIVHVLEREDSALFMASYWRPPLDD